MLIFVFPRKIARYRAPRWGGKDLEPMLQSPNPTTRLHQFIVDVEVVENGPTYEQLACKLADALTFVEGTGHVDVGYIGDITDPIEPEGYGSGV